MTTTDVLLAPPKTTLKGWVDRLLGRVTMYRLVLIVLAAMAAYAVVLAHFDQLFYSPLAMVASLGIALATTYGSTWVAAKVVKARIQWESSAITGLLLFFLFWPSLEFKDLGVVALAGLFAGLSKFVLAWRGRHIANPAAIGAVLVALFGFGDSVWWVATEPMWPAIAIGALLVLYRTGRLGFGLLFAVPALLLVIKAQVDFGATGGDAITIALTSTPILFLAGFMLSEPLTQAPLRWQRAIIALVVALLFVSPLYYPSIYSSLGFTMTPELALVIGNVIAFGFGQRGAVALTLRRRRELSPGLHEFTFTPRRPLRAKAGQYVELHVPHSSPDGRGQRRVFSILSGPGSDEVVLATRVPPAPTSYKRALMDLTPGSTIRATGVGGDFLLPRNPQRKIALIAGGIGVTPFVAQAEQLASESRDAVVVYASANGNELAYLDRLAHLPGVVVTANEPAELPHGWTWIEGTALTADVLAQAVPDLQQRAVQVSGSPVMVTAVKRAARSLGARRVRTDAFAGY